MKAHLLTSEYPIQDGQAQTADCGAELSPAWIQWCWDSLDVGTTIPLNTMSVCGDCVRAAIGPAGVRQRYVYGIGPEKPAERHEEE